MTALMKVVPKVPREHRNVDSCREGTVIHLPHMLPVISECVTVQYLFGESELVSSSQLVLQVVRRSAAFQTSALQEGDAIAQDLGFIQVMCGQDNGTI